MSPTAVPRTLATMAEKIPTMRLIWDPQMTWEKMSAPSSLIPTRCWALGGLSGHETFGTQLLVSATRSIGPYGASHCAKTAIPMKNTRIASPTMAVRLCRIRVHTSCIRRRATRRDAWNGETTPGRLTASVVPTVVPSRNLDPRVEQKEDEVGDEVRKYDRNAPDDDDELEERKVEVVDGLDCLPANSVVVENDLHLIGSTEDEGDVERDQGGHRRQTARENVTAEDLAVAQPFRLRGRDEVLRHDVNEGAAHDERDSGERAKRKGQGRQDEVLSGARQVGSVPRPRSQHVVVVPLGRQGGPPREVVTDDGAFLEHCEEEEPEPEDRHPIEEDSRGGRKDVERLASFLRCD